MSGSFYQSPNSGDGNASAPTSNYKGSTPFEAIQGIDEDADRAEAAAAAAQATLDNFDDRYLGAKAANPTVDNDGNTLLVGALYFNTVANEMRAWNGSTWQAIGGSGSAAQIANTPAGNISSTNVQAAINELDAEKQPLDADLTSLAAAASSGAGPSPSGLYYRKATDTWAPLNLSGLTINPGTDTITAASVNVATADTPPGSPNDGDLWFETDTGTLYIYYDDGNTAQWVSATSGGLNQLQYFMTAPQGRLTLQSLTPVMTSTQAAKTTIYYTPYVGNGIPLYNGAAMIMTPFSEISVATTDTTKSPAAIGASKVNDWFVWDDAGTLRLSHGPDWTSDTTRSAGTALVMVNGIYLNNASITNGPAAQRGTYVGTTRSDTSSQLNWIYGAISAGGTNGVFAVWNAYNRVYLQSFLGESTNSWTYSTATWRAANNSATMRHYFVAGLDEDAFQAVYNCIAYATNQAADIAAIGVGLDSTSTFTGSTSTIFNASANIILGANIAICNKLPGVGFHFVSALELGNPTGTAVTFIGDNNSPNQQSGLSFSWRC